VDGTSPREPILYTSLLHWATRQPDATFVREVDGGQALTYRDCLRSVQRFQRWLGPDPRTIVLALPASAVTAVVWLAALTGRHRLIPCSPECTPHELTRLFRAHRPDFVVLDGANSTLNTALAEIAWPTLQVITRARLAEAFSTWAAEDDLEKPAEPREGVLYLTTSGTTGEPKSVRLRAGQIAWTAEQIRLSHRLTRSDTGLAVLPFFHINAPVVSLCATLQAGGTVVLAPRFSRSHFWSWIAQERITWASVVPTIVALLLQSDGPTMPPASLRFVRTASAPLPATHLLAFERRFHVPVIETYGLSEAASQVTANPVPPARHKPGSVGLPAGVSLRVCVPADDDARPALRDVAPGEEGEICISGPSVIASYGGGAGAASFVDGWFRTGDLGHVDPEGYVYLTGRLRDVINCGGHKVAPREVEEVLLAHPSVSDAAVIGEDDPLFGQRIVAYVVPTQGAPVTGEALMNTLRPYCATRLSAYKVPSAFSAVPSLPRTRTGKIQRHLVASAVASAVASPVSTVLSSGKEE
jgi:acyl-CoA synthetase (AMP-forming)/AMP-acid ligase II